MARISVPTVSEHEEQANFIEQVTWQYSNREDFADQLLFAPPNGAWLGGTNKFALLNKYRAEGFKNGVADLLYLQPRGGYAYLAMELKAVHRRGDHSAVAPEQAAFLEAVNKAGGTAHVCYGCDELMAVFDWYMCLVVGR